METQKYIAQTCGAQLIILENGQIRTCALDLRAEWRIGRLDLRSGKGLPDIPLASPIASRDHGWLQNVDGAWYYTDTPTNLNGTFYNGEKMTRYTDGRRNSVKLADGDVLRIDNMDLNNPNQNGVLMMFSTSTVQGSWTSFSLKDRNTTLIGRDSSCDICLPLPYLSANPVKITQFNDCYYLSDCGSTAGTYLNGSPATGNVMLREKDRISLCDCTFFFLKNRLLYQRRDPEKARAALQATEPANRPVILKADIQTKQVKNHSGHGMKALIRDIHLEIREGALVALLGTAGAGKSTVMNCLNGMDLGGVQGSVIYRDVDLTKHFDQVKFRIGSVPQKKVFLPAFTPEEEFRQAAILRLPADTTRQEIQERVDKTLQMLSITGVRKNRNSKLSRAILQLALCAIQSAVLCLSFWGVEIVYGNQIPETGILLSQVMAEYYISVFLVMYASDTMGLMISCFVKKEELTSKLAPYILIVQLLFSGVLFSMKGASEHLSALMLSRWGMEALGSITNLNALPLRLQEEFPMIPHEADAAFEYTSEHLLTVWLILIAFVVVPLVVGNFCLRRVKKDGRK